MKLFFLFVLSLQISAACVLDEETKLYWCAWDEAPTTEIDKTQVRYCASGEAVVKTERGRPYCGKLANLDYATSVQHGFASKPEKPGVASSEMECEVITDQAAGDGESIDCHKSKDQICTDDEHVRISGDAVGWGYECCKLSPRKIRLRCKPVEPIHAVTHGCKNCADPIATATPAGDSLPLTASFLP